MNKYKVKNIKNKSSEILQMCIEDWITSRDHISISSMNAWSHSDMAYAIIVYMETEYSL